MGVSWQSVTGADGYQIKYSSRKDFKTYKYVPSYSIYSDTDAVISDYDLSKRYYFKVRAYKTVNGKKIYGNWSAAKAFKYYY
jgi:hypothetical protein